MDLVNNNDLRMGSTETAASKLIKILPFEIYTKIEDINKRGSDPYKRHHLLMEYMRAIDPITYLHSIRVARGTVQIAQKLGCPERLLSKMFMLGAQHDVGKFAIQHITQSAKKLTEEERAKYLPRHCTAGALIAQYIGMPLSHRVVNALHHFETKGYPSFEQLEETEAFANIHLTIMEGFYNQIEDRRFHEVTFDTNGVMCYGGVEIPDDSEENGLSEMFFGVYAASVAAVADGTDAGIFLRKHDLGDEPTAVEKRVKRIGLEFQNSRLPRSVLGAVNIWLPTAELTLVKKSDFEKFPALMAA